MTWKRGVVFCSAAVVLALTIVLTLDSRESRAPEMTPVPGELITSASARGTKPSSLQPSPGGEKELRLPAGSEASPPLVGDGEQAVAAIANERPIVARGRVNHVGGELPEDVDVILFAADGGQLDLATAAEDGTFALRWDEPLVRGWSVGADAAMLAPDSVGDLPLHLPGDPPVEVELVLGFAPVITGRVLDRATGAAIEAAEINAGSTQPAWELEACSALSQKDGSFRLELGGLPLRGLFVWCRLEGWQAQLVGPRDVQLARAPGECLRVDFLLDHPATWRGRVASGRDGSPVSGATITIGNDLGAFSDSSDFAISDENGSFELQLPDVPIDGAWVHAAAEDFAPVALRGVKTNHDLCIVLHPPVTLIGTVTTRGSGRPCEGATVRIAFDGDSEASDIGLSDEAFTDFQGVFEVELESAPGDAAKIRVDAPGHLSFEAKLSEVVESAGTGKRMASVELLASP